MKNKNRENFLDEDEVQELKKFILGKKITYSKLAERTQYDVNTLKGVFSTKKTQKRGSDRLFMAIIAATYSLLKEHLMQFKETAAFKKLKKSQENWGKTDK